MWEIVFKFDVQWWGVGRVIPKSKLWYTDFGVGDPVCVLGAVLE